MNFGLPGPLGGRRCWLMYWAMIDKGAPNARMCRYPRLGCWCGSPLPAVPDRGTGRFYAGAPLCGRALRVEPGGRAVRVSRTPGARNDVSWRAGSGGAGKTVGAGTPGVPVAAWRVLGGAAAGGTSRLRGSVTRLRPGRAAQACFDGRAKEPTWRKRGISEGFCVRDTKVVVHNRAWAHIAVPKLGPVKFKLSRGLPAGKLGMARITCSPAGRWHVSLPAPQPAVPDAGRTRARYRYRPRGGHHRCHLGRPDAACAEDA